MAQTTYTRVLPDLTQATRRRVYEKLAMLFGHLPAYGVDLLSIVVTIPTRTIAITLSDPVPSLEERQHVGLEDE